MMIAFDIWIFNTGFGFTIMFGKFPLYIVDKKRYQFVFTSQVKILNHELLQVDFEYPKVEY